MPPLLLVIRGPQKNQTLIWHACRDNFKQLLDDELHDIKVEVYSVVVESRRWQMFFAACQYLTWDGLQSLVNAFTAWAGPQITEIEQEITGLVSKQTFQEFFKEARAKEEGEEGE